MKTVFTNGCFDVLHRGHVEYLTQSRALGDRLIVGLNSDESVRRLKGPSRPVNKQEDRAAVLLALRCVDDVHIFDEDTPYNLILQVRPDLITKGGDYMSQEVVGADIAEVAVLPFLNGYSSTGSIDAIARNSR